MINIIKNNWSLILTLTCFVIGTILLFYEKHFALLFSGFRTVGFKLLLIALASIILAFMGKLIELGIKFTKEYLKLKNLNIDFRDSVATIPVCTKIPYEIIDSKKYYVFDTKEINNNSNVVRYYMAFRTNELYLKDENDRLTLQNNLRLQFDRVDTTALIDRGQNSQYHQQDSKIRDMIKKGDGFEIIPCITTADDIKVHSFKEIVNIAKQSCNRVFVSNLGYNKFFDIYKDSKYDDLLPINIVSLQYLNDLKIVGSSKDLKVINPLYTFYFISKNGKAYEMSLNTNSQDGLENSNKMPLRLMNIPDRLEILVSVTKEVFLGEKKFFS